MEIMKQIHIPKEKPWYFLYPNEIYKWYCNHKYPEDYEKKLLETIVRRRRPTWEDYINSLRTNEEYLLQIMTRPKV